MKNNYGKLGAELHREDETSMSVFHFIDNKRESNITLERVGLLEHWKNPVLLLMKDKDPVMNGVLEIYLTIESINERIALLSDKTGYSYCQITCIQAVNAAINGNCIGLSIHGLAPEELYITKIDLMEIKEPVAGIIRMMEILSETVERKEAFQNMGEQECYLLGSLPEETDHMEDFDVMKSERRDGQAVKVFFVEAHAEEANTRNFQIKKYSFAELAAYMKGKYAIVVEPYEEYRVEFSKDEVNSYTAVAEKK